MTPRIACVGELMVDVLAALPGPLAAGSDTPAPVSFLGGGAAANVAAWSAAAGVRATFVGRVGDDVAGRAALDSLHAAGVDTRVDVLAGVPTGACIVLVAPDGERTMVPSAGANAGLLAAAELPTAADLLYLSGYALFHAPPGPVPVLDATRAAGRPVAVDAASAAPLLAHGPQRLLELLGPSDLLFANADEAQVLTGTGDPRAAVLDLGARVGAAVVKCGADGSLWSDGSRVLAQDAVPAHVVDTTGAGDAFAAGFLAAVLHGGAPSDALAAAAELAARAISVIGARPVE